MSYENTEDLGTLREQLHRATEDCGRLQKLLDESEQRYHLMADNVKDVIFVADMEGRIRYITPFVQHMLGYTVRECMGRGLGDIMTPESRRVAQQKLSAAVARGWDEQMAATNVMAEYELVHKDGSTVWAEVSTSFIRDSRTQLAGVVGSWRDVSDRRRIHQALSSSEEKYRLLVESLPAGVVIGQDSRIVFANSAAARITGYSVEQLLSLPPAKTRALVHPDDWELAWRPFGDGLVRGNECGHFEARVVRSDGEVRSVEALVRSIEYRGEPAVEATCVDVTGRRLAEKARREGEEKFTRVYEDSPIGIILYDASGKPVEMNAAAAGIFGLADDFAVKAPSIFDDPSMADEAKAKLRNGAVVRWEGPLDLTRARELDWYGTTRSGTICISIVVAQLGQKEKGVATGYIAQIQDITERKQAEQKLQEAYQEERRLRGEVEREMKSRHEFLRALVHELKTPVTAVIASGELLAMELPEGPLLRAAEILNRSAENLNKRIDELLDLARGELGM
ncbi:MAG: PAS domain S-box protein, partial [Chloroflexi bacterium]|nr:PAS domain S-box protein [Chloroflexota bacterium]